MYLSNCKIYLSKLQNVFALISKYLYKLSNEFAPIAKCICQSQKMYLSKLDNLLFQITKYICSNNKVYLSKLQNVFLYITKCSCTNNKILRPTSQPPSDIPAERSFILLGPSSSVRGVLYLGRYLPLGASRHSSCWGLSQDTTMIMGLFRLRGLHLCDVQSCSVKSIASIFFGKTMLIVILIVLNLRRGAKGKGWHLSRFKTYVEFKINLKFSVITIHVRY